MVSAHLCLIVGWNYYFYFSPRMVHSNDANKRSMPMQLIIVFNVYKVSMPNPLQMFNARFD